MNDAPFPLTDDMLAVIEATHLCFCATVTPDGLPNLSPKGTIRAGGVHRKATRRIRMEEGVGYEAAATVLMKVTDAEPVVSPGYLHVPDETAMRIHWRRRRDDLDAGFERFLFGEPPYRHDA